MNISIVGTGYVGLVSGVCLADKGHKVVCVDVDEEKIHAINAGQVPFHEDGLSDLLKKNISVRFKATTDLVTAIEESELTMIAVGTPFHEKGIDLTQIEQVSSQIGKVLGNKSSYHVVVVKSTVTPGTTEEVVLPLLEKTSGKVAGVSFGVGMNPEFLREGEAVTDFLHPDRIVLGGIDEKTINVLENLYGGFPGISRIRTTPKTAEMIKYAANSLLATLISFSNEIGNLCAVLGGIDVVDVMKGVHLDKRISPIMPDGERVVPALVSYLAAGCGFGGSCFPKDVKALTAHGAKKGSPMRILDAVMTVNEEQPLKVLTLLEKHFPDLQGVAVAVLGLAFKPGTDDIRESPALPIVKELLARGANVKAYDPIVKQQALSMFPNSNFTFYDNIHQALDSTEAIVLLTGWNEFFNVPKLVSGMDPSPVLIDGRRMLDKHQIAKYEGIGL